jgi:UDP-N-acetyl-D-glucosamine dehydrogenase
MQQVAAVSSDPSYKILLIGISYKPNIDDIRESPAIKIWELFEKLGHTVSFYDPYIPEARGVPSISLTEEMVEVHDIVVVVTNHANIDYSYLASFGKPIIDTRHVYVKKLPHIYYV